MAVAFYFVNESFVLLIKCCGVLCCLCFHLNLKAHLEVGGKLDTDLCRRNFML